MSEIWNYPLVSTYPISFQYPALLKGIQWMMYIKEGTQITQIQLWSTNMAFACKDIDFLVQYNVSRDLAGQLG